MTGTVGEMGGDWESGGGFSEFPPPRHCAAISVRTALAPKETKTIDFILAWDLPAIRFGQNRTHFRHHTERWGCSGRNACAIAAHAAANADAWRDAIDAFHADATGAIAARI